MSILTYEKTIADVMLNECKYDTDKDALDSLHLPKMVRNDMLHHANSSNGDFDNQ